MESGVFTMKKTLYLLASLFFGFLGISAFGTVVNPAFSKDMPSGFLITLAIIGAVGILSMKYFWKKFREPEEKEILNENGENHE